LHIRRGRAGDRGTDWRTNVTITYPLAFPGYQFVSSCSFIPRSIVGMNKSPYTASQQVYLHQGQLWEGEFSIVRMNRANHSLFKTFFGQLFGPYGTFLLGDPDATSPRGVATGTPLVDGASQTGSELVTDGWTASTESILCAGDYIQLGTGLYTRMHMLTEEADSDSAGASTLKIFPCLRTSPADNDPITLESCKCLCRLTSGDAGEWRTDCMGLTEEKSFSFIEAI
jgi:hypothetical protein